ncbi:hypothetical protein PQX77_002536, partial [Marasmius sp. AFHP31]
LRFSLRLSGPKLRRRLAYLGQSLPISDGLDNSLNDLVFIDNVQFSLVGTFRHDPATFSTPAYLFVPPIPVEKVNNVHCIRYPLTSRLFYWCSDRKGRSVIHKKDWEKFNIPHLEAFEWIGSSWGPSPYKVVRDHLHRRKYPLDGKQYARDYGYSELIHSDPHDPQIAVADVPDRSAGPGGSSESWELVPAVQNPNEDDSFGIIDNETKLGSHSAEMSQVKPDAVGK